MAVQLNLEIDVQKIIQGRETHWDFYFANDLAPDDLMRGFELKVEEIDFKGVDRFGDLNSFFGLNIEFNPHLWALVWGGGYNVQFNLYADTYDEKCVNVFASLGLLVLLCRCERNNRTLQAAKLILKARDKALLLLRTQPKKLRRGDSEIEADVLKLRQKNEVAKAKRVEELKLLCELSSKELACLPARLEEDKRTLKARSEASKLDLKKRLQVRRQELESALEKLRASLEELRAREKSEPEALEKKEQEDLRRLEEKQASEKTSLERRLESEQQALSIATQEDPSSVDRESLAYTQEQRKANKARASAIRLKARAMSFVDKRSFK